MSIQIIDTLKELSNKDIFYKLCLTNKNLKDRFGQDLSRFQYTVKYSNFNIMVALKDYLSIIPFYLELATRINEQRKNNTRKIDFKVYKPYDFDGYRIVNNHLVLNTSDYLKMRLGNVIDVKMVKKCLRFPIGGENRAQKFLKNAVSKIKLEDDWVINSARDMMKSLMAICSAEIPSSSKHARKQRLKRPSWADNSSTETRRRVFSTLARSNAESNGFSV